MATVITTTSPPAPPAPLPDLPRAPDSDLSRLACAVLEYRDFGALTRLPDMLRDMGRDADAEKVMAHVGFAPRTSSRSDLVGKRLFCPPNLFHDQLIRAGAAQRFALRSGALSRDMGSGSQDMEVLHHE